VGTTHRAEMFSPATPGEADLIVAKHRNGAIRDITVAFQGHYPRFRYGNLA
jgi:replicative DNA helicase